MNTLAPHVLIVDGDQTFARTLSRLLAENGYDPASLSSGTGLTEYLATHTVDLLLLDLSLPGEDGFSIIELLRRDPEFRHLPVLALSAVPLEEHSIRALGIGGSDVIGKPIRVRELLARIRAQLRAGRALDQARAEARSRAALLELLKEITISLPPRELFQVLVRQVAAALRIPRCSILFGRPGAERMRVAAASENPMLSDLSVDTRRYPEIQKALQTGEVVLVRDAPNDPLYQGMTDIETRSSLVLPFSLRGERAGVFFLRTGAGDPPLGETDLHFAARVSDSATVAIERALDREETGRRDESQRQIEEADPLTGLLNAEALDGRLRGEMERAGRNRTSLTCIRIHLGDLKRLLLTHGGNAGDRILVQFAELLRREQRAVDVVARNGEAQFAMLLPETSAAAARPFAERILAEAARTAFGEPDAPATMRVNLGLATFSGEPGEPDGSAGALLEMAGRNLERARSDGRNSYRE